MAFSVGDPIIIRHVVYSGGPSRYGYARVRKVTPAYVYLDGLLMDSENNRLYGGKRVPVSQVAPHSTELWERLKELGQEEKAARLALLDIQVRQFKLFETAQ